MGATVTYRSDALLSAGPYAMIADIDTRNGGAFRGFIRPAESPVRRLTTVYLKADIPITEVVRVVLTSHLGTNFDTILAAGQLTANSSFSYVPPLELTLHPHDRIALTCTNTGGVGHVYGQIEQDEA